MDLHSREGTVSTVVVFGCVLAQQRCLVSFLFREIPGGVQCGYQSYGALCWPVYTASHVESTMRSRIGLSALILAKPGTALPLAPFPSPFCAHAALALHGCTPASEQDDVHERSHAIVTRLSLGPKVTPQVYASNSSKGTRNSSKSSETARTCILGLERSS